MNVQVNKPKQDKPFPKLMISKFGSVVFFRRPTYGFLLAICKDDNQEQELAQNPEGWIMEHFTDFEGSITLSND